MGDVGPLLQEGKISYFDSPFFLYDIEKNHKQIILAVSGTDQSITNYNAIT